MITFNIEKPDAAIAETLQEKINKQYGIQNAFF